LLVVGVIALILLAFVGDGVHLSSFPASDKSDAERKQLLDRYNSMSGNLMTAITKVIDIALQLLVAVSLLCFAADWTIRRDTSTMLTRAAPSLCMAVLSFLICNGPTALNVQLIPKISVIRITAEDLSSQSASNQTVDATSTVWDQIYSENASNNSVLNNILRTQLTQTDDIEAPCFLQFDGPIEPPHITFGYPPIVWSRSNRKASPPSCSVSGRVLE
jgi:hypothetical protein